MICDNKDRDDLKIRVCFTPVNLRLLTTFNNCRAVFFVNLEIEKI